MKGFTLIEILIYMAVSTMISVSFISLAFALAETEARIRQDVRDEEAGLLVLRVVENAMRKHEDIDPAKVAPDVPIKDVTKSAEDNVSKISFAIGKKIFSVSVYEK